MRRTYFTELTEADLTNVGGVETTLSGLLGHCDPCNGA